jgi:hypothetical protein
VYAVASTVTMTVAVSPSTVTVDAYRGTETHSYLSAISTSDRHSRSVVFGSPSRSWAAYASSAPRISTNAGATSAGAAGSAVTTASRKEGRSMRR